MAPSIPKRPEDLSAAHLNELVGVLRPGLTVVSADITDIKSYGDADNAASVSTSAQVKLDVRYGGRQYPRLPPKILAKVSFPDDIACSNPILDAEFENEVSFYNRLRPELDIETPLGLGGHYDPQSKRFILLMEDLSPRTPHINSMMDEDDLKIIRAILETLAKLHAHYWESPRFKTDLSWVQNQVEGNLETLFAGFLRDHVVNELKREKFKREFAQQLNTTESQLFARTRALKRHQATLPQTILHGDAHFANTYVLPGCLGGVLDWQVSARGFLMHDVGYFIQTALSVEGRRTNERSLLAFYRDRLCSYGATRVPDLETLWLEYRRSMIYGFHMGWLTAPRENYGWEVMVLGNHRTKAAYLDHETGKLIDELL
jgi:hypothetical protein